MTRLGVDIQALRAASRLVDTTAADFGQDSRQVRATPVAAGATVDATILLEQALDALAGALNLADSELQQVATQLSTTADTYTRTEQMLAKWMVPGSVGPPNGGR